MPLPLHTRVAARLADDLPITAEGVAQIDGMPCEERRKEAAEDVADRGRVGVGLDHGERV